MALFKGFLGLVVCCLSANWAASQKISREVLDLPHGVGRVLVDSSLIEPPPQQCMVDFMKKDYSALNQCIMPFPKQPCCEGFMEVACPVTTFINNMETNCATDMFAGIYHSNPTLPPGYFSDNCSEGPEGIDCITIIQRNKMKAHQASPPPPHRVSAQQGADSLAARKAEIMRHHPKLFPQQP